MEPLGLNFPWLLVGVRCTTAHASMVDAPPTVDSVTGFSGEILEPKWLRCRCLVVGSMFSKVYLHSGLHGPPSEPAQ